MDIFDGKIEMPMGLGMALARNTEAMAYFATLTPAHQREIIEHTHTITSKKEMQRFVDSLAKGGFRQV